jgi:DNA modification methylase
MKKIKPYYSDEWVQIYHGDFLEIGPEVLADNAIDMFITSPPYNVGMEYEEVMDWKDYYELCEKWLKLMHRKLRSGGIMALNLPKDVYLPKDDIVKYGRRVEKISSKVDLMAEQMGFLPRESIVWVKAGKNGVPICASNRSGADNNIYLRRCSEMILLHSKDRYHYDGGTGKRGVKWVPFQDETKEVWFVPAENSRSTKYPAPWPIKIPYRLMNLYTHTRKHMPVIVDPFCGSGQTLKGARIAGRKSIGFELVESYCEEAANRCRQQDMFLPKPDSTQKINHQFIQSSLFQD